MTQGHRTAGFQIQNAINGSAEMQALMPQYLTRTETTVFVTFWGCRGEYVWGLCSLSGWLLSDWIRSDAMTQGCITAFCFQVEYEMEALKYVP